MYAETGDPKATATMLMHSEKSQMMDRYTIGGVALRLRLAAKAFSAVSPVKTWHTAWHTGKWQKDRINIDCARSSAG